MKQQDHYTDLDGMRGALAVAVMLFHFGLDKALLMASGGRLDGRWTLCVDFFFILSGFVIAKSFGPEIPSPSSYFVRRLCRLAPMFLLTTIIAAFLGPWGQYPGIVVINLAMVQSLVGVSSVNGPGWSVPFELFFPMAALVFWPFIIRHSWFVAALALAASASGAYLVSTGIDILHLRAGGGLLLGFALYALRPEQFYQGKNSIVTMALFGAVVLTIASAGTAPSLAIAFPAIVAAAVVAGRHSKSIFSTPPMQALGRWSYGIYLTHVPVVFVFRAVSGSPTIDSQVMIKLAMIAATITVSAVLYKFVEDPITQWAKRFKDRPMAPIPQTIIPDGTAPVPIP